MARVGERLISVGASVSRTKEGEGDGNMEASTVGKVDDDCDGEIDGCMEIMTVGILDSSTAIIGVVGA